MKVPKLVVDLVFTLAIPLLLLSDNLFKTGFSFSEQWGARNAYIVAALIPTVYILIDFYRTRVINPYTIVAASSALLNGALAFLQVDGWKFALRDSYAHIVIFIIAAISLALNRPFFGELMKMVLNPDSDAKKKLYEKFVASSAIQKAVVTGTVIIMVEALLNGTINFIMNYRNVVADFGTKDFNAQKASVDAAMRPISIVMNLISYGLAFYFVTWNSKNEFGEKASPMEDHFWEALEQHHNPQVTPNSAD